MLKCSNCETKGIDDKFICDVCEEPICEDCTAIGDGIHPIERTVCISCYYRETSDNEEIIQRQNEIKREIQGKKDIRNAKARKRYWSLEQVEKRKEARRDLLKTRLQRQVLHYDEAMKVFRDMF